MTTRGADPYPQGTPEEGAGAPCQYSRSCSSAGWPRHHQDLQGPRHWSLCYVQGAPKLPWCWGGKHLLLVQYEDGDEETMGLSEAQKLLLPEGGAVAAAVVVMSASAASPTSQWPDQWDLTRPYKLQQWMVAVSCSVCLQWILRGNGRCNC